MFVFKFIFCVMKIISKIREQVKNVFSVLKKISLIKVKLVKLQGKTKTKVCNADFCKEEVTYL